MYILKGIFVVVLVLIAQQNTSFGEEIGLEEDCSLTPSFITPNLPKIDFSRGQIASSPGEVFPRFFPQQVDTRGMSVSTSIASSVPIEGVDTRGVSVSTSIAASATSSVAAYGSGSSSSSEAIDDYHECLSVRMIGWGDPRDLGDVPALPLEKRISGFINFLTYRSPSCTEYFMIWDPLKGVLCQTNRLKDVIIVKSTTESRPDQKDILSTRLSQVFVDDVAAYAEMNLESATLVVRTKAADRAKNCWLMCLVDCRQAYTFPPYVEVTKVIKGIGLPFYDSAVDGK